MKIRQKGDTVVINTLPDVQITAYTVNAEINWQLMQKGRVDLKIDRAGYYAVRMDKVTYAQLGDKKTMDEYAADGAEQMRKTIDTQFWADVYLHASTQNTGTAAGKRSSGFNLGATGSPIVLNKANVTELIAACADIAEEQNWPRTGRWMAIPTWMKYLLAISELKDVSVTGLDKSPMLNGGYVKTLHDFDLFVTNLYTPVYDSATAKTNCYNITFGHKTGITFAAQLTEMEYHEKFEKTFGQGMKGLQVYDWKVVKPEAVGVLYAHM